MPARRVLFLADTRLAAYRVGGGSVAAEGEFSADQAGLEAFAAWLARRHGSVFTLLADVAEEGFQLEDIPHASGRDRAALVARRLAQHFHGTPLTLAVSRGRLKQGRRDERLLLMGLTRPRHFEPWLAALRETESALAGIHSLPQAASALLPETPAAALLLITLTRAGLRQTFFADGHLRFSRLTPLAADSPEETAAATAAEAARMHQYLAGQRLVEHGQPLTTRVLAHPDDIPALRARCRDGADLRFEFLDLPREAARLGLRTSLADSRAETLFCHLLAKRPPAGQFAPAAERRCHRLRQIRVGLRRLSGLILAAGLLFAAREGMEALRLQEDIDRIAQQTRQDQRRHDEILQALPQLPLGADDLRALIGRYEDVLTRAQGPGPLLAQLSRSLDAHPAIVLERIEWSIVERSAPDLADGPHAQVRIDARLPLALVGDPRGQRALVAGFARHLGAMPATQATVLQQPVDTQSGQTLRSGGANPAPEAPRFSLRLTRKL